MRKILPQRAQRTQRKIPGGSSIFRRHPVSHLCVLCVLCGEMKLFWFRLCRVGIKVQESHQSDSLGKCRRHPHPSKRKVNWRHPGSAPLIEPPLRQTTITRVFDGHGFVRPRTGGSQDTSPPEQTPNTTPAKRGFARTPPNRGYDNYVGREPRFEESRFPNPPSNLLVPFADSAGSLRATNHDWDR